MKRSEHPNAKKRAKQQYRDALAADSRFTREKPFFSMTPDLVREVPGLGIPSVSEVEWSQETKDAYEGDLKDGFFFFTGGVCWPTHVEEEGLVGMGVVLALDLKTLKIWMVSERKFITIERTDDYPEDAPTPLYPWLRSCLRYFRTRRFYQSQADAVVNKFRPAVIRTFPKTPRPSFISFPWNDFHTAMQTMREYIALDRFQFYDSRLWAEMQAYDAIPDGTYPALHAACVAVSGLDRLITSEVNIKRLVRKLDEY